jgi:hypothetical protein
MIGYELPQLSFDFFGELSLAAPKVKQRIGGSAFAMILPHAANGRFAPAKDRRDFFGALACLVGRHDPSAS